MKKLSHYIKIIRTQGKHHFTLDQTLKDLDIPRENILAAIHRMKKRKEIISPAQGLYFIIPLEYQLTGFIPIQDIVPVLMQHWHADYYVGLLTAAMYHGSSHQKPQIFQVISSKKIEKQLIIGQMRIDFIYKKNLKDLPTQEVYVKTGYLKISSPEVTTMDLFLYPHKSGGLNHTATVLSELIEVIDSDKLIELAERVSEKVWVQRFGYILDNIDPVDETAKQKIMDRLQNYLSSKAFVYRPLAPELNTKNVSRCKKWKIIENTKVESDE